MCITHSTTVMPLDLGGTTMREDAVFCSFGRHWFSSSEDDPWHTSLLGPCPPWERTQISQHLADDKFFVFIPHTSLAFFYLDMLPTHISLFPITSACLLLTNQLLSSLSSAVSLQLAHIGRTGAKTPEMNTKLPASPTQE